jgi:hypothetical protein
MCRLIYKSLILPVFGCTSYPGMSEKCLMSPYMTRCNCCTAVGTKVTVGIHCCIETLDWIDATVWTGHCWNTLLINTDLCFSATVAYAMWHEKHFWSVIVLRRVLHSSLVLYEWNLISHLKGRTQIEDWEQGAEKNIWMWERLSSRRLEKITQECCYLYYTPNVVINIKLMSLRRVEIWEMYTKFWL